MTSVLWFRRDLRLADHPALGAAADDGPVVPLFVVDPALTRHAGAPRLAYLSASLRDLDARIGGLVVRHGRPEDVVPAVAAEAGAEVVHVSADLGPYGGARDRRVEQALARDGRRLERTGSPYAVTPGRVRTGQGRGYQVFTPYLRAWLDHGWRGPAALVDVRWRHLDSDALPDHPVPDGMTLPDAGEEAALARWQEFLDSALDGYADARDRPDLAGTTQLSTALKWGEVHPRTLLADLGRHEGEDAAKLRAELAWREFHADVLWHQPGTARRCLNRRFEAMELDPPGDLFRAWQEGRTGFPIVDAGMRQLRATGWMHNRVRMIVASFLVKDLHLDWRLGARHFMDWLVDGDLASNQLNWQWVAGCGADAAPYFRVFNPTTQAAKFDPSGAYQATWEQDGYPEPVLDHAAERREALARLDRLPR